MFAQVTTHDGRNPNVVGMAGCAYRPRTSKINVGWRLLVPSSRVATQFLARFVTSGGRVSPTVQAVSMSRLSVHKAGLTHEPITVSIDVVAMR